MHCAVHARNLDNCLFLPKEKKSDRYKIKKTVLMILKFKIWKNIGYIFCEGAIMTEK